MLLNALGLGKGPLHGIFLNVSPHQKKKKAGIFFLKIKSEELLLFFSILNESQLLTSMSANTMADDS